MTVLFGAKVDGRGLMTRSCPIEPSCNKKIEIVSVYRLFSSYERDIFLKFSRKSNLYKKLILFISNFLSFVGEHNNNIENLLPNVFYNKNTDIPKRTEKILQIMGFNNTIIRTSSYFFQKNR